VVDPPNDQAMAKPVQWMTLQELRDELERTARHGSPWIWMASLPMANSLR
jgi:hypothetical protein